MRKRKPRSLIREYYFWGTAFILVVVAASVLAITILTDGAMDGVIRQDIRSLYSDVSRNLTRNENGFFPDENYESDYEGFSFSVIDENDNLVLGEIPEEFEVKPGWPERARRNIQKIRIGKETYFVLAGDLRWNNSGGHEIRWHLLVWIQKSKVVNRYRRIQIVAVGIILLAAGLYIAVIIGLNRRLSASISVWMERIRSIGDNLGKGDMSHEQPDILFQEFEGMYIAHDRLVRRMNQVIEKEKQFNNDISHELRTPLAVIRAQAQLVLDKKPDRETMKESMERILKQTGRIQELLNSLLELAHLEDRRNLAEEEDIELDEVIRLLTEEETEERNARFVLDLQAVRIHAQIDLVIILLRNLISNAVKHGKSEKPVEISLSESETEVNIRIRDYGPGISEQDQARIYEAFFRGDHSRSTPGNGLGLTLAKKVTEFFGGTIQLESEVGTGSIFTVSLPKKMVRKPHLYKKLEENAE